MSQSPRKRSTRATTATPPVTLLQDLALQALSTTAGAASQAVQAWRQGGHRLVAAMDQRLTEPVATRTARYAPRLAQLLRRSTRQAGAMAGQGIDWASTGTDKAIDIGTRQLASQVRRMAGLAYAVRQPLWLRGLDSAARFTMPGARAAVALSQRFAALAARLQAQAAAAAAPAAKGKSSAQAAKARPGSATTTARRRATPMKAGSAQPVAATPSRQARTGSKAQSQAGNRTTAGAMARAQAQVGTQATGKAAKTPAKASAKALDKTAAAPAAARRRAAAQPVNPAQEPAGAAGSASTEAGAA